MKQPIVAVEELKDSIGHLVKRLRVDRRIMGATDSCSPRCGTVQAGCPSPLSITALAASTKLSNDPVWAHMSRKSAASEPT